MSVERAATRRAALRYGMAAGAALLAADGLSGAGPARVALASTLHQPRLPQTLAAGRPMYQYDAQHSGRSPHTGPRRPRLLRTFDTAHPGFEIPDANPPTFFDIQSSAAVGADGTIYLGTFAGTLFALQDTGRGETLQPAWYFHVEGASSAHATPAVAADGTVYLAFGGRSGGTLYALQAPASGLAAQVVWTVDLGPGRPTSSPTIGPDGTIYALNSGGQLFAVGPDGNVRWTAQAGPVIRVAPAVAPDGTIYVPSGDGNLYAVTPPASGALTGAVAWTFDFGQHLGPTPFPTGTGGPGGGGGGGNGVGSGCSPTIGPDGTVFVGANNSNFYAVEPNGTMKWLYEAERETAGIWGDPALSADGGTIFFGANKGGIYALDTATGALRWQSKIFGSIYNGQTLDARGTLYTGSTVGHFFGIDASNGQWHFDYDAQAYPGIWTAPAILPSGAVAIATRRGLVMLFGE